MGVLGLVLGVLGWMAIVASVNARLPLVIAALFGQKMPVAPSYNSLQQSQGSTSGSSSFSGASSSATGSSSLLSGDPSNWDFG